MHSVLCINTQSDASLYFSFPAAILLELIQFCPVGNNDQPHILCQRYFRIDIGIYIFSFDDRHHVNGIFFPQIQFTQVLTDPLLLAFHFNHRHILGQFDNVHETGA